MKLWQKKNNKDQNDHSKHYIQNCLSNQEHQEITDNTQKKWLINLSSTSPTQAQRLLLAHGPNFSVTPHKTTLCGHITAIELACQNLDNTAAKELRPDVYSVLRHQHHLKPNLSRDEMMATKQLKTDKD